jgi:hypothetical protein
MKVLYLKNGEIINAIYDKDWFKCDPENLKIYDMLNEDDTDNKVLVNSIIRYLGRKDDEGLGKHYIKDGELYERKNWREQIIKGNIV